MILRWFIRHQWLEMRRSSIWQRSLILNIVIAFLLLILLLNFLILGLLIDEILAEGFPERDPVALFNGVLLYYFGFELFIRFMMQDLPVLNIETYLHLPIKKSSIVHYVAGKSIVAIGNYLPLLITVPFAFKVIAVHYNPATGLLWLVTFILLAFSNNFLATYLKRQLTGKPLIVGFFVLGIGGLVLLNYFNLVNVTAVSAFLFDQILIQPLYILFPLLLLSICYAMNYFYLKSRLYPDEVIPQKDRGVDSIGNIRYLEEKGFLGQLIFLDLRLIWRHKRTRSIVYMAPLFLGYGFFFYPQEIYLEADAMLIFVGIFMTGGMMLNYTNYCFSYESNYFDNVLSNYRDFQQYLNAKYLFAVSISTICYILTIPYVFFSGKILFINTMTFLYNIGILSLVLFYTAMYSTKKMDLSKGAAFNYQGMGASHWLSMIPAFLMPVMIYLPFGLMDAPEAGFILIGILGLAGLVFHKTLMNFLLKQFIERKYKMAEGFRE